MRDGTRAGLAARALLTLGALLPYWRLLTFGVIFVTDDHFTSDIFNGELPGRVLVGRALRAGTLPLWTSSMCSGYPLAGAPADPSGLALFTFLPPAAALDALVIVILLVAAHGAYSLARRFDADRYAAALAGLAFAGCGYIATQLKHLSIMSTIAWLPFGLVLVDRAILDGDRRKRALMAAALGLVFAQQVLAGFPQSAYICALVYGAFALFRVLEQRRRLGSIGARARLLSGLAIAMLLGAAAGAIVLLPLADLTTVSDRVAPLDYRWATYTSYWPPNFFTFFVPYINGDGSDGTYTGPSPFWENYAYLGAATALLAIYGALRDRRRPVPAFLILMTITAFAFALGARTPAYHAAFLLIPGMNHFRAPTRFLVVVELGIALLAAIGLTRLRKDLEHRWGGATWITTGLGVAVCVVTAADLFINQPRQNPMVRAGDWLAPPATVGLVRADTAEPRTFTPHHRDIHRDLYDHGHGWTDLAPFHDLRDLLEPNLGVYWNLPVADCYVGLPTRWYISVWGYHYFESSLVSELAFQEFETHTFDIKPGFAKLLGLYGVTHVLTPYSAQAPGVTLVGRTPRAYVYRLEGAARVRVVPGAVIVPNEDIAGLLMRNPSFDPGREVLLMSDPEAPPRSLLEASAGVEGNVDGHATILGDSGNEVSIDAFTSHDGFLLLADTYHPGWRAEVDGVAAPIYRADISLRAIALPKGHHAVRFVYHPVQFFRAIPITLTALCSLIGWTGVAWYRAYA
jgi:hypothetical protein